MRESEEEELNKINTKQKVMMGTKDIAHITDTQTFI